MVVLIYGQPSSGKTTLGDALCNEFSNYFIRLDGDVWREISENKDYSKKGRLANLKSAFDMAIYLDKLGYHSILSFVTPYESARRYLRSKSNLVEIYLECNEERERTKYHAKDFELPQSKECLQINTSELNIDKCLDKIIEFIIEKNPKLFSENVY
jgi:adenylylsulfate kinase-like enzyme